MLPTFTRKLLALAATTLTLTACSHAVIIDSDPSGAEIKVNGEKLGKAPVTYNETTGWEKVYDVEAALPGYKPMRKEIKQQEWNLPVAVGAGGCSLLLGTPLTVVGAVPLIGLFWARQLPDRVVLSMDRGGPGTVDPGTTPPSSSYGY
jgi:hypothetical protein